MSTTLYWVHDFHMYEIGTCSGHWGVNVTLPLFTCTCSASRVPVWTFDVRSTGRWIRRELEKSEKVWKTRLKQSGYQNFHNLDLLQTVTMSLSTCVDVADHVGCTSLTLLRDPLTSGWTTLLQMGDFLESVLWLILCWTAKWEKWWKDLQDKAERGYKTLRLDVSRTVLRSWTLETFQRSQDCRIEGLSRSDSVCYLFWVLGGWFYAQEWEGNYTVEGSLDRDAIDNHGYHMFTRFRILQETTSNHT
jgi:hypothetical protein